MIRFLFLFYKIMVIWDSSIRDPLDKKKIEKLGLKLTIRHFSIGGQFIEQDILFFI